MKVSLASAAPYTSDKARNCEFEPKIRSKSREKPVIKETPKFTEINFGGLLSEKFQELDEKKPAQFSLNSFSNYSRSKVPSEEQQSNWNTSHYESNAKIEIKEESSEQRAPIYNLNYQKAN